MTSPSSPRRAAPAEPRGVTFLASVTSLAEARLAAAAGADIVDCKEPAAGSLGALPLETIAAVRAGLPGVALSATVGDPSEDADAVSAAVLATAETGVDFVKVGVLPGAGGRKVIGRIGTLRLPPCRLVAVMLADRGYDIELLASLAPSGFSGVMLDTDDKSGPPLPGVLSEAQLATFIAAAQARGLFAGLAGALRLPHIAALRALQPDVLGFRGALCRGESRTAALDAGAIAEVRRALGTPYSLRQHDGSASAGALVAGAIGRADRSGERRVAGQRQLGERVT